MALDGGFNLGTAYAKVVLDASGIQTGIASAQNSLSSGLQSMGSSISSFGQSLSGLGASLTVLTAPLALFAKQGIQTASDFDSAMAEISARTGLTGEALENIRNLSLKMGADTSFSAQQAADAFLQLLASGQTAEEAIATLPVILDAAAASGEDLGRTADVVTDIMAAFHLGVSDAASVVDSLARAAGASSADMSSLGQGFANIGGIAAEFGLSVDETSAILAIFSENGIKGAEAGTQLRSMLRNMTQNTEKVKGTWLKLGTSMFDTTGKIRPLGDVMKDITKAMDGMTDQQRIRIFADLGGAYGQMGLSALTAGMSIEEMQGRMENSAGASEVAAARMDTFAGRMESLKGSIETLMIEALTPLMDNVLKPFIEQVIVIVNGLSEWAKANPELVQKIALIAGALTLLGPILVAVGLGLSAIGSVISVVGVAIGVIMSPIGLLIGGVTALALAFSTNFLGIRDTLQPIIDDIVAKVTEIITVVSGVVTEFMGWVNKNPEFVVALGVLAGAVGTITVLVTGFHLAVGILTGALGLLFSPVVLVVGAIVALVAAVQAGYPGGISQMLRDAATSAQMLAAVFLFYLGGAVQWVRDRMNELWQTIQNVITAINDLAAKLGLVGMSPNAGIANAVGNTGSRIIDMMQNRDSGGAGMAGSPYLIGTGAQPEMFIPNTNGTFIPNADKLMGGGDTYNVTVSANSYAEGQAAGQGFTDEIMAFKRARGLS